MHDPTLPDTVRRFLDSGAQLEVIALDDEGNWSHQGEPFENDKLKLLFHRSITRTEGGTWLLSIPPFSYPITVADTPYHVRTVDFRRGPDGTEQVVLSLSDETEETLDPQTLRYVPGRGFYCRVKQGRFEARFNRPAYYTLADRVDGPAADGTYTLALGSTRHVVPGG